MTQAKISSVKLLTLIKVWQEQWQRLIVNYSCIRSSKSPKADTLAVPTNSNLVNSNYKTFERFKIKTIFEVHILSWNIAIENFDRICLIILFNWKNNNDIFILCTLSFYIFSNQLHNYLFATSSDTAKYTIYRSCILYFKIIGLEFIVEV